MREKKKEPVKVFECDESGGKEASVASEYRMDCRLEQGDQGRVWRAWAKGGLTKEVNKTWPVEIRHCIFKSFY